MQLFEWRPIKVKSNSIGPLPDKLSKLLFKGSLILLLLLSVVGFGSTEWPIVWQLFPFYIGLFILGMPHGAADHLLIWGLLGKDSTSFRIVSLLIYISLSGIYLLAWGIYPIFSALFFLVLTIFHWGQGDRYISAYLHGAHYLDRSRFLSLLHLILRGSLPIVLPGYLGNEIYHDFFVTMVKQSGKDITEFMPILEGRIIFLLIPLILFILYTGITFLSSRQEERKALLTDLVEGLGLFLWFLFIPPIWAIGIYFVFWHSLRHALRILWIDQVGQIALESFKIVTLSKRWLSLTTIMTILALLGLWFTLSLSLTLNGMEIDWLGKAMIGISILTLPHTVLVCLLDKRQSV